MDRLKSVLNGFNDLSVLDVATGTGAFLDQIMQFVPTHCQARGTGILMWNCIIIGLLLIDD